MNIIDVSQPLGEKATVWPNDQPFALAVSASIEEDSSVHLKSFQTSTHTGTHVDAPLHVQRDGASVDAFGLSPFIGPVEVVAVPKAARRITAAHIQPALERGAPRLLVKTRVSETASHAWTDDFPPISAAAVEAAAAAEVVLIGTDAPSVDPADSTDLPAHHALVRSGIPNLENLNLHGVAPGAYWLVALPLCIEGGDAAPVRAALLPPREARSR